MPDSTFPSDTSANPSSIKPGDLVGRYLLGELLGKGGMGMVFRAEDTALHRAVAVKVLPADVSEADPSRLRFEREARSMARLSHRNVVGVHDFGFHGLQPFIVMELIRGTSLRQWLTANTEWRRVLPNFIEAARGLAAAHAEGIIHRDFKPENVLVGDDGRVAVADFGISRDATQAAVGEFTTKPSEQRSPLTLFGALIGTPRFMAPEQFTAHPVTPQTDQFSFGVALYEAVCGQHPFISRSAEKDLSLAELGAMTVKAQLLPVPAGNDAPAELHRLIAQMLKPNPGERFAAMREVIERLEALLAPTPEVIGAPRQFRPIATGLAAMAIAVAAVVWFSFAEPAPSARSQLPASARAFDEGMTLFHAGSTSPAVRKLSEAAALDPSVAAPHLWIALLDQDQAKQRDAFAQAIVDRRGLNAHDSVLLDALAPGQTPLPDVKGWIAEVDRQLERAPRLGVLHYLRAKLHLRQSESEEALTDLARAAALDPSLAVPAKALSAIIEQLRSNLTASLALFKECLTMSPRSTDCLERKVRLEGQAGECAAMEADARKWIGLDPQSPEALAALANALVARTAPLASVQAALDARWALLKPDSREKLVDQTALLTAQGDFEAARTTAQAGVDAVPPGAPLMQHISPSFDLLLVLRESGDDPAAIALAQSVLDRAHAWAAETPQDLATTLVFAEKLFNMGALTREQFDEARNRWFAATSIKPTAEPASSGGELGHIAPWFVGYADVDTREAAIEALETLPRYGKLPPPGLMNTGADLMVGKLFALADRGPEALPYLQTVSRSCLQLMNPHAYGQALVWLGRVSESVGDLPAAREAYGRVLARWGKSRPRSVTAEKAAERLAALGAN